MQRGNQCATGRNPVWDLFAFRDSLGEIKRVIHERKSPCPAFLMSLLYSLLQLQPSPLYHNSILDLDSFSILFLSSPLTLSQSQFQHHVTFGKTFPFPPFICHPSTASNWILFFQIPTNSYAFLYINFWRWIVETNIF